MPIKITYFVHGTTIDNEKEISSGWFDVGLSEVGIKRGKTLLQKIGERSNPGSRAGNINLIKGLLTLKTTL